MSDHYLHPTKSAGATLFKFIGFIAGFYFFGFFGALLGLLIGSMIDRLRKVFLDSSNQPRRAIADDQ